MTLWFTGLPGAGKSTLAKRVAEKLLECSVRVEVLDGDIIRGVLSSDLGYSKQDRDVNIRRIGFLSQVLSRNGVVVIVAAISPYRAVREEVRRNHDGILFVEIFVDCPLEVLVGRDTKGLYQRALRGEIRHFTGVSDPYETPENPDIIVHTSPKKLAAYIGDRPGTVSRSNDNPNATANSMAN